jgi:hypothetical protein
LYSLQRPDIPTRIGWAVLALDFMFAAIFFPGEKQSFLMGFDCREVLTAAQ